MLAKWLPWREIWEELGQSNPASAGFYAFGYGCKAFLFYSWKVNTVVKGGYSVKSDLGLFLLKLPRVHLQILKRSLNSRFSVGKQMRKTAVCEMRLIQSKPLMCFLPGPKGWTLLHLKGVASNLHWFVRKSDKRKIPISVLEISL